MMTGVLHCPRPRRRHLLGILLMATVMAAAVSCQSTPEVRNEMTVEAARELALEFQGRYQSPPPRGLGERLQRYVEQYRDLAPEVLEKCSQPRRVMTNQEIRELGRMKRGSHMLRRFAEEAFYDGSLEMAIRLCDAVINATGKSSHKSKAKAYKAFFLAQGGDPDAARASLGSAIRHYDNYRGSGHGGETDCWGEILRFEIARAEGAAALAEGDLQDAEIRYYKALRHFDRAKEISAGMTMWELPDNRKAIVKAELSRVMRLQGRLNEAEIWAREALAEDDYRVKPMALMSLSEIRFARSEFDSARRLALSARNLIIDRCVSVESLSRAAARALHARTLVALERWTAAVAEFETIEKEMVTDPETFARGFRDDVDWGLAMTMAGAAQPAAVQLEGAVQTAARRYGAGHYNTREAEALLGMAWAAGGRSDAALAQLERTVPQLLALWKEAEADRISDAFRKQKLRLILETYIGLLTAGRDPGRVEKAFAMAGALQAQSVGRSLAASAARSAVNDPELAALIRQRQDLEVRTRTFQERLARIMEGDDAQAPEQLRVRIAEVEGAMAALDEEIRSRFPRYSAIVRPDVPGVEALRAHLRSDEALIAFFAGSRQTFVWALPPSGPLAFASVPMGRRELAEAVDHLRNSLDPGAVQRLGDLPDFDVAAGFALYQALLAPVAQGWQGAESLLVVPDGPLGRLPLSVLPVAGTSLPVSGDVLFANYRSVPWLARSHAVTLLPSVPSLVILRSLPAASSDRKALAAYGDPVFSAEQESARHSATAEPLASRGALRRRGIRIAGKTSLDEGKLSHVTLSMLQPLPDTAVEAVGIADALGADQKADLFLGARASEGRVRSMPLDDRKVLVFATHGLVPGDLDGLWEPALALSAPEVTGETGTDGLLTMGEVMGLSLDADWVVLSACNTAAGSDAGAEAVSGLGQAFFYAGARSLLVTGWPVETTSATALTTDLFRRQNNRPGVSRALALKEAMAAVMDADAGPGFAYAHPLFWAPYMLVGDGR